MAYLYENKDAGDDALCGILRCRLSNHQDIANLAIMERALERLVAQGQIKGQVLVSNVALNFGLQ